jgi:hypothetical protein
VWAVSQAWKKHFLPGTSKRARLVVGKLSGRTSKKDRLVDAALLTDFLCTQCAIVPSEVIDGSHKGVFVASMVYGHPRASMA